MTHGTAFIDMPPTLGRFEGWTFRDHIGVYIARMETERFSARHTYRTVRLVGEFARWLIDQHGDGSDVHELTAARFITWRAQRSNYQNGSRIALARLLGFFATLVQSDRYRRLWILGIRFFKIIAPSWKVSVASR